MDAVIKLRPEELTEAFFKQLQALAGSASQVEIRIGNFEAELGSVNAINGLSAMEIQQRLDDVENDKTVTFTKEELEAYIHKIAD